MILQSKNVPSPFAERIGILKPQPSKQSHKASKQQTHAKEVEEVETDDDMTLADIIANFADDDDDDDTNEKGTSNKKRKIEKKAGRSNETQIETYLQMCKRIEAECEVNAANVPKMSKETYDAMKRENEAYCAELMTSEYYVAYEKKVAATAEKKAVAARKKVVAAERKAVTAAKKALATEKRAKKEAAAAGKMAASIV
jgi:hypothetical protein